MCIADRGVVNLRIRQSRSTLHRIVAVTTSKQPVDKARSKLFGTDAVLNGGRGLASCPVPLKFDRHRLDLLGEPSALDPSQYLSVIGTGSDSPDLVLVMREHDCFADASVGVLDGHEPILPLGGNGRQSWMAQEGSITDRS